MNLFLDKTILEQNPRKIYNPPLVSDNLISKIIPYLCELKINTVRIWPTSDEFLHQAQISDKSFKLLAKMGIGIILNLPVNWNLKPCLTQLKSYVNHYSALNFPNILLYCINNEAYHGFFSPKRYTQKVHTLVKTFGKRPTLLTNANLNYPWIFCADVIGADFFTYKYSISRDGSQDVGAVAKMFLEDAQKTYKIFPKMILQNYFLIEKYLSKRAEKNNFDPDYFHKNLYKLLRKTKNQNKPYIIAEYGYTHHPNDLDKIFAQMPIKEMEGHVWYNWINFDPEIDGCVSNIPLYRKFKTICEKMQKIKEYQGYNLQFPSFF